MTSREASDHAVDDPRTTEAASLADILTARASMTPDALAFEYRGESVTFEELRVRARQVAAGMAAAGVRPGDRVALVLPTGLHFVHSFWAVQLLGATGCALNPYMAADMLQGRLRSVAPKLVVTPDTRLSQASDVPDPPEAGPDAVAALQITSGTSGVPRASIVTQRNAIAQARSFDQSRYLRPDDVLVGWVPPWHDMGLHLFVVHPVFFGAPCHLVDPAIRTIPDWLATIERAGGTYTAAPDFAYRLATRLVGEGTVDISSLRLAGNGGEPVRRTTIEAFESHFGIPRTVMPAYGLAEATLAVTTNPVASELVVDERENVCCGAPYPGVEVRAGAGCDDADEILVRGDTVFGGYLGSPEDSARALRDGWLHTGDQGYLDDEGRLYVLGRRISMIKRGGAALAPRELEEPAQRVPGVKVVAAVGLPSASGDDAVAVVAESDAAGGPEAQTVVDAISREVTRSVGFAPSRIVVVPPGSVPRTHNGKIRHAALRQALLDRDA